jgi:hypothetical protein
LDCPQYSNGKASSNIPDRFAERSCKPPVGQLLETGGRFLLFDTPSTLALVIHPLSTHNFAHPVHHLRRRIRHRSSRTAVQDVDAQIAVPEAEYASERRWMWLIGCVVVVVLLAVCSRRRPRRQNRSRSPREVHERLEVPRLPRSARSSFLLRLRSIHSVPAGDQVVPPYRISVLLL